MLRVGRLGEFCETSEEVVGYIWRCTLYMCMYGGGSISAILSPAAAVRATPGELQPPDTRAESEFSPFSPVFAVDLSRRELRASKPTRGARESARPVVR